MSDLIERCDKSMFVRLTPEIVHAGRSSRGGWSRSQLEVLGVDWPPREGWVGRLDGLRLPGSTVAAFLRLKDAHLAEGVGLFDDAPDDLAVCPSCGGPVGAEACGCTPPARAADEWQEFGEPVG